MTVIWLGYTSFIPVYTKLYYVQLGAYWNIPPFTWNQAQAVLRARFVSAARLCRALLATFFLSPVCLMDRPPRRGLQRPNCHSHGLTFVDIAAPSSVQSSSVGTAKWEACFLALAEHVRDSRSRVTSQKQWDKKDPAHHTLDEFHPELC